jgi:hypothetical protein
VQRRRAEHVGTGEPGRHLVVAEHAEPVHAVGLGVTTALHLGRRSFAGHPQDGGTLQRGESVEQHVEPFTLLVPAEEQDGGAAWFVVVTDGHGRFEALHVDPVEEHLEVATTRMLTGFAGGVGDRDLDLHAAADEPGQQLEG